MDGGDPDKLLETVGAPDFKAFLEWICGWSRIESEGSLGNYWKVLRMHILDKRKRPLDDSTWRDVINVSFHSSRRLFQYALLTFVLCSSRKNSQSSTGSVGFRKRKASAVSMTSITFSSFYGSSMIRPFPMSSNGTKSQPAFSWPRTLV